MRGAAAYLAKSPAITDARRILTDRRFIETLRDAVGDADTMLKDMSEAVRRFEGMDWAPMGDVDRAVRGIMRGLHVSALGLKPWISAVGANTGSSVWRSNPKPLLYMITPTIHGVTKGVLTAHEHY